MVKKALLWLAGAKPSILEKVKDTNEENKQIAMAILLICTTLLGSLSGGYAFYTLFNSVKLATLFGAFWGLIVGGFDRIFVLSSKKSQTPSIRNLSLGIVR